MELLFLLGRLLFGGYFISHAINHFKNVEALAAYASSRRLPFPRYFVYISGVLILLGGIGIILGIYVGWAVLCLILFLVPTSIIMHNFWKIDDQHQMEIERSNFLRNMALIGAAIMMLSILEPWSFSLEF